MTPSIRDIQLKSCEIWGLSLDKLLSRSRIIEVISPRHLGIVYAASLGYRSSQIARAYQRIHCNINYVLRVHGLEKYNLSDLTRYENLCQSFTIDPGTIQTRQARSDMLKRFKIA